VGRRRADRRSEADVVAFPGSRERLRPAEAGPRLLPSSRSITIGLLLLVGGVGVYAAARETSIFAIRDIRVEGSRSSATVARVEAALAPLRGSSLVGFDAYAAQRRLSTISDVSGASFDRAFPHTLRVHVRLERVVAVARQGGDAWLVSSSGRIVRRLERPYPPLPRIWLPQSVEVSTNATLGGDAATAVQAVAPLRSVDFPAAVRSVLAADGEITLVLDSGTEVRLGGTGDLRLKLAIAEEIIPLIGSAKYIDVSVPERPVSSPDSQVVTRG
jgi:cell division septal protein FtsQ